MSFDFQPDTEQKADNFGFIPESEKTPKQHPGLLSEAEQAILNIGGGLERGVATGLHQAARAMDIRPQVAAMMGAQAPAPTAAERITGALAAPSAAPFAEQQAPSYKAAEFAGQYGPEIMGAAGLARGVAGLGARAVGRGLGALTGRNIKNAEEALQTVAQDILKHDYYNDPNYVDTKLGNEEAQIGNVLKTNYKSQLSNARQMYTNALKDIGDNKISGELKVKEFKELPKLDDYYTGRMGKLLDKSVNQFKQNPTYNNLHDLQSKIGKKIGELKSAPYGTRDYDAIDELSDVRNKFTNFLGNKVGEQYKAASRNWKENIIPYQEDNVINKLINKNQMGNFSNRLTKTAEDMGTDEQNAIDKIISHMNDEQKDTVILPSIAKTVTDTTGKVNEQKLLNNLLNLRGKGFGRFMDENEVSNINRLQSLLENIERQKRLTSRVRKGALFGAGIAGLGRMLP